MLLHLLMGSNVRVRGCSYDEVRRREGVTVCGPQSGWKRRVIVQDLEQ